MVGTNLDHVNQKGYYGGQKWPIICKYTLSNIHDLLDKLGKFHYLTTLDLANGFHQIEMEERGIEKMSFSTENDHFDFLMLFGLKTLWLHSKDL